MVIIQVNRLIISILHCIEEVVPRLPIETLMSASEYKKQRDLFLQAFAAVQEKKSDDPKSFFQVAGIHGLPYVPYDHLPQDTLSDHYKEGAKDWFGGYCHHGDILFPTWHRPYMILMERLVYEEAGKIVDSWKDLDLSPEELKVYQDAAKKIRMPYWDWANTSVLITGIPPFFFDEP